MYDTIRIATRKSPLALWQAQAVKIRLLNIYPNLKIELVPFVTEGDKILDRSLSKIGGKGLFVKELEQALLNGDADIAVHSMKDVPMHLFDDLEIAAIMERGSVEDVFISKRFVCLQDMPFGARVGTSSARRKAMLHNDYPHLQAIDVRGNVQTRLEKCFSGDVDALILAAAGLERLELSQYIAQRLPIEQWLPAPGQGAIGVEMCSKNTELKVLVRVLNDADSWEAITAERSVSRLLNGGCGTPLAAYAMLEGDDLWLRAWWINPVTHQRVSAELHGSRHHPERLGKKVAEILLS